MEVAQRAPLPLGAAGEPEGVSVPLTCARIAGAGDSGLLRAAVLAATRVESARLRFRLGQVFAFLGVAIPAIALAVIYLGARIGPHAIIAADTRRMHLRCMCRRHDRCRCRNGTRSVHGDRRGRPGNGCYRCSGGANWSAGSRRRRDAVPLLDPAMT